MIKGKGKLRKIGGVLQILELEKDLDKLPDNQNYNYVIYDQRDNRLLPHWTYLFSVVLAQISQQLPDNPSTAALYKYFEEKFAPLHTCLINGEKYEYPNLKGEKTIDVSSFIESITEYVHQHWNITIIAEESLKDGDCRDFYVKAYTSQEVDWNKFISSKNK